MQLPISHIYKIFLSYSFLMILIVHIHSQSEEIYRESVKLHLSKNYFLVDEPVWINGWCLSNSSDSLFRSKAVYIELVNGTNESIIGQIYKVNKNTFSGQLIIPDTLSSGYYFVKAYTQWMRNFSSEHFFSKPVFIWRNNQFSGDDMDLPQYVVSINSKVYLNGGVLIDSLPATIGLSVPPFPGIDLIGRIINERDAEVIKEFYFTNEGKAEVEFIPQYGARYTVEVGDNRNGYKRIHNFQGIKARGYAIHLKCLEKGLKPVLSVVGRKMPSQELTLKISKNGQYIWTKKIIPDDVNKDQIIDVDLKSHGLVQLQLVDSYGTVLAHTFFCHPKNVPFILTNSETYSTREMIRLMEKKDEQTNSYHNASVSVYRSLPMNNELQEAGVKLSYRLPDDFYAVQVAGRIIHALEPEIPTGIENRNNTGKDIDSFQYYVEDHGTLLTGNLDFIRSESTPKPGEVFLVTKDRPDDLQGFIIGETGKFAFLSDHSNMSKVAIVVPLERKEGVVKVGIDNKFHFDEPRGQKILLEVRPQKKFLEFMQNEAKRNLIQYAYNRKNFQEPQVENEVRSEGSFYGQADYTVLPSDYIFLPDFFEISKEIIPNVSYKKDKSGCRMLLYMAVGNQEISDPLILVDGIPVKDICFLGAYNSDDIERIEVVNRQRIFGSILVNGVIAIFTSDHIRNEKRNAIEPAWNEAFGYQELFHPITNIEDLSSYDSEPDFRNCLYWHSIETDSETNIGEYQFFSSDQTGKYTIEWVDYSNSELGIIQRKEVEVIR